jgi:DNA-binding HxlR family transcriptional regulator
VRLEKVTNGEKGDAGRGYLDACGLAHALELIGERWALLILRELMFGPRRFGSLKSDLPGISANVLTQRLGELEARGLVRRRKLPPPASVQVYEATEWGLEARPIICSLARWAFRSPRHDGSHRVGAVAMMLSMSSNFDPVLAAQMDARIAFHFGEKRFFADIRGGKYEVHGGEPPNADLTITCDPDQLKAVVYGGAPLDTLHIEGDRQLALRFTQLFSLPPKVS